MDIPIGTRIRPVISNDTMFLITEKGFALSTNIKSGEILWSKNLFKNNELNLDKFGKVTSLFLLSNQIVVSTKNGYFIFMEYNDGEIKNYSKVSKSFIQNQLLSMEKFML